MIWLTSDNASAVHPVIWEALSAVNAGYAKGYGGDDACQSATAQIREVFEAPQAEVLFVTTGTAANALALATLVQPWQSVLCHPTAHIQMDECGAPEFYTSGAKLALVAGADGRIEAAALEALLCAQEHSVHMVQAGALSLTNVTEVGTVYSAAQTAQLCAIAKSHGLPVHLDGARLANALAATGAAPADLTHRAGVDVLSLGGTKNGLMNVEAVVLFDPSAHWQAQVRRKRAGQLASKGRYLGAQFDAAFTEARWLEWARHANAMAARLDAGLRAREIAPAFAVEANIVFVDVDAAQVTRLEAAGVQAYGEPKGAGQRLRFVTSWSTTASEIDAVLAAL
ncbi:Low specificity L-threonine aldolase [Aquimixticola soesokkakensis]|uniref:Low specificity L-threonine aldolase n=1 Tax=Aquimixticola soesokkakensis TaxID=1519096 RepID=A0A1Y5RLV5_9RHOB|nr:aminotransferase class V-fold PLP-dependent enzyme [Aquimixticola soesokkakensis]SLN20488.1 Low specificity L-threonine aldolase [Aquimixticola soesokkakensis]